MGKSKRRIINNSNGKESVILKRTKIISQILSDVKNHNINDNTIKYINLFGITLEELSESGADYEELSAIKHLLY